MCETKSVLNHRGQHGTLPLALLTLLIFERSNAPTTTTLVSNTASLTPLLLHPPYLRSKRHRRHLLLAGPGNGGHLLRQVGHELQIVVGMHAGQHFYGRFVEVRRHFELPVLWVKAGHEKGRGRETLVAELDSS